MSDCPSVEIKRNRPSFLYKEPKRIKQESAHLAQLSWPWFQRCPAAPVCGSCRLSCCYLLASTTSHMCVCACVCICSRPLFSPLFVSHIIHNQRPGPYTHTPSPSFPLKDLKVGAFTLGPHVSCDLAL